VLDKRTALLVQWFWLILDLPGDEEVFVRTIAKKFGEKTYRYAYLVENHRVAGKIRQRLVLNLGAAESISTKRIDAVIAALQPLSSSPEKPALSPLVKNRVARLLGPVLVAEAIWDRLGIASVIARVLRKRKIELDVPLLSFGMVANRLVEPRSKLALTEWYRRVHIPGLLDLSPDVHQFYRAMDALLDCKEAIERHTAGVLSTLFNQDFSLVFYDLTSTYFEGRSCPLAAYGYSRDHRDDKLQITLGLVVTGDGLPVASDVFVGNTADASTVSARVRDLKERFGIARTVFVGDRGMLSAANVAAIASEGYEYISSIPTRGKVGKELVGLAGDLGGYQVIGQDKLLAKEVKREGDARRYIVCHSFERAEVDSGQRERRIERALPRLNALKKSVASGRTTLEGAQSILADIFSDRRSRRYFRYELSPGNLTFELKEEAIAGDSACDGRFILVSDATDLPLERVIASYKDLKHVESAFDELKNFIEIRPVYHYNEERVRSHVFICVLSYLLERVLELTLGDAGLAMTARRALDELETVQMVSSEIDGHLLHGPTEGSESARTILEALAIPIPKASLTALPATAPAPAVNARSAESTLF
jgi:transposase